MTEEQFGPIPRPRETDWVLICGHVANLPYHLYTSIAPTIAELNGKMVAVPTDILLTAPDTPVHWMAMCVGCRRLTPGELHGPAKVVQLKELREDFDRMNS